MEWGIKGNENRGSPEEETMDGISTMERKAAVKAIRNERRSGDRTKMVCLECGREFGKRIGANTYEVRCPRCGSYDTEVC